MDDRPASEVLNGMVVGVELGVKTRGFQFHSLSSFS